MNAVHRRGSQGIESVITTLFVQKPPILIEVRFPKTGTSPDWFLRATQDEFAPIFDRLGPGRNFTCTVFGI